MNLKKQLGLYNNNDDENINCINRNDSYSQVKQTWLNNRNNRDLRICRCAHTNSTELLILHAKIEGC